MQKQEHIYRVDFKIPPFENSGTDFYFTSLAAIYELFTPEQIGCKVEQLWKLEVSSGFTYQSRNCSITQRPLYRKSQTRRKSGGSK